MQSASLAGREPLRVPPSGVLAVEGFGAALSVQYGCLRVRTGTGNRVRVSDIERASRPRLRRVVIVGKHAGYATLPALAWIEDVGASWAWLDWDGEVLGTSSRMGLDDARLRRAQAFAAGSAVGLDVVRFVLVRKIEGQAEILRRYFPAAAGAAALLDQAIGRAEHATHIDQLREAESTGAALYWDAWRGLGVTFPKRELSRIPARWHGFEKRSSRLDRGPRRAADPINACLNLCYGLAEGETRLGLTALGLDAGLAFGLHTDQPSRASAALDVMEAVRPVADGLVLDLIEGHTLPRSAFVEAKDGQVRIAPELASSLVAAWVPALADAVAPIAERIREILARAAELGPQATPLTQSARSVARDPNRRKAARRAETASRVRRRMVPRTCAGCGSSLAETGRRRLCDECLPISKVESVAAFAKAGPAALARMREAGTAPVQRAEVREKIGRSQAQRRALDLEWDAAHPEGANPAMFEGLLPGLRALPLRAIAEATGLSVRAASDVRSGKVPHPRHWESLKLIL